MGLSLLQAPAKEPVTLEDAKAFARLYQDLTDDDAIAWMMVRAARMYAESYCGRSLITQKWRLTVDAFPGYAALGLVPYGTAYSLPGNALLLERGPVQSVDQITYIDMSGTTQTVTSPAAPDYAIDLSDPIARITPGFGKIWPITQPRIGAAKIDYTAGYGPKPTDVPDGLRHWICMRAATLYENREEVALVAKGKVEPLPYVDFLLDPYRVILA